MQPYYIIDESKLLGNLVLIKDIATQANVEFILAFKAFAQWRTFSLFRPYVAHTTASSLYEARLAYEEFGSKAHTYSPAYEDDTFDELLAYSSHITFNSLSQYERFYPHVRQLADKKKVEVGIRINPEYSEIETDLYNPCASGSRFGVLSNQLPNDLPEGITGFHCHTLCESSAEAFVHTLQHIEDKFGRWFKQLKWINFGGGHLVTRADYDVDLFVQTMNAFHKHYPWLQVRVEPGSAFLWRTGSLVSQVVDVVENKGIKTAILNVSFTCHMPDCLEMPYHPQVRGAETLADITDKDVMAQPTVYRLGGNSCLSGDYMGYWRFAEPLNVGDVVTFEDMIHYTTVKTNMFNGIHHPAMCIQYVDGTIEMLRAFTYEDYKNRMN